MKILAFTVFFLALLGCTSTQQKSTHASQPNIYTQISYPNFIYEPPFPPEYKHEIAPHVIAYLVPDRRLPWIQISAYYQETTLPATPAQSSMVALASPMIRKGGAGSLSPLQMDDTLEFLAAGIRADLGSYHSSWNLQSNSQDFPQVLLLLKMMLETPLIDSARLEIQKSVYLQNIIHKYDKPADVVQALSRWAMYQSGPRMWNARSEEVQSVKSQDILALVRQKFQSENVVLAVSGDFQVDSMKVALASLFTKPVDTSHTEKPQALVFKNKPGLYLVNKQTSQANIRMEQPFVKRPHPDYYATAIASYILGGGGFTSRLTTRVRSDEGLAYSVYSFTQSDYDEVTTSGIALQTKISSAAFAMKIIREEVQKLTQEGPTAAELESAKSSLIESLPGIFDTPHHSALAFAQADIWGRSPNHFKEYPQKIRAITAEDVKRALAKYFDWNKMTISIVGPVADLLKQDAEHQIQLSDFGQPQIIALDSLEMR